MNINPISNVKFNGGSIQNIKVKKLYTSDGIEENVNLTVDCYLTGQLRIGG